MIRPGTVTVVADGAYATLWIASSWRATLGSTECRIVDCTVTEDGNPASIWRAIARTPLSVTEGQGLGCRWRPET